MRWACLSSALIEEASRPSTRFGIRGGLRARSRKALAAGLPGTRSDREDVAEAARALGIFLIPAVPEPATPGPHDVPAAPVLPRAA